MPPSKHWQTAWYTWSMYYRPTYCPKTRKTAILARGNILLRATYKRTFLSWYVPPTVPCPHLPHCRYHRNNRYFINVCVDSTLGLAIIYGLIKLSSRVIHRRK